MRPKQYAIAVLIPVALLAGVGLSSEVKGVLDTGGENLSGFVYDSHGRRNPFVPLVVPTQVPTPTPAPEAQAGFLGQLLDIVKPPAPDAAENQDFVLPSATPTAVPTPTPTPVIPPSLDVTATIIGEGRPSMVLIGGSILLVGEMIDKAEITKIEKGQIEILYCGKTFTLESGPKR